MLRRTLPLLITLACSYQLLADRLDCKALFLLDKSDCAADRSFAEEIDLDGAGRDYTDCLDDAHQTETECRAEIPSCQ